MINFLHLKENKMECVVFADSAIQIVFDQWLGPLASLLRMTLKNLGVLFNGDLTFDK